MGKITKIYHADLIEPTCDRHANKLQIEESNDGEVHIHFRNLKIALEDKEIVEWKRGFLTALGKLRNEFIDDL